MRATVRRMPAVNPRVLPGGPPMPIVTLAATILVQAAFPVPADWPAFLAEYGPRHDAIAAHLRQNVRVVAVSKQYGRDGEGITEIGNTRIVTVADATRVLYRRTEFDFVLDPKLGYVSSPGTRTESGGLVTPDAAYEFARVGAAMTFKAVHHPWDEPKPGRRDTYFWHFSEAGLGEPLCTNYLERGPNRYRPVTSLRSFKREVKLEMRGVRPTITVSSTSGSKNSGWARSTHYFRLPDYFLLGHEQYWEPAFGSHTERIISTIEYGPPQPDTGLPFPTRVTGTFSLGGGPAMRSEDITFEKYERTTPAPAELDPLAQFGVAVPPPPPRPPLPTEAEWQAMLAPKPRPATSTPPPPQPPPPAEPWRVPRPVAALITVACVLAAAVGYRKLRV